MQQLLKSPPHSSASPQIGKMEPLGLPSGAKDISIEETRNPPLDAEFLDLAYTMQNMGLKTVSDMMLKLYAAMAKSYPKHKGEPLDKFRPDPEKTLAQQSQREKEEGQGKPKYKQSQVGESQSPMFSWPLLESVLKTNVNVNLKYIDCSQTVRIPTTILTFWSSYEAGWVIEITDIVEQYPAVLEGKVVHKQRRENNKENVPFQSKSSKSPNPLMSWIP
ncbi:hypothetical protein BDD12DRAFT_809994 [Trichophaea hybrida]|nr:hypothetical protein BDD12DRAFT_809994 [Trichophaea hybrida]